MLEIEPADWSALLEHADAIDFFNRPEPAPAGPSDRIFHLAITAGNRSGELAINDSFEASELAHLITLTRRAMRDPPRSIDRPTNRISRRIGAAP